MKKGKSLNELADELTRQRESKQDFIGDTSLMEMDSSSRLSLDQQGSFEMNHVAHRQLGSHLGIDARYYDRMLHSAPELLRENVNHWLHDEPSPQMVRTMDGVARAFLSNSYRCLDNYDLAEVVLPALMKSGAVVQSCDITDTKLYIKATLPDIREEIKRPGVEWGVGHNPIHVLQPGVVISNSEVGMGALSVYPAIHTIHCSNLAVFRDAGSRRHHTGRKHEVDGIVAELISDRTKLLEDAAIFSKMEDVVNGALGGNVFTKLCDSVRASLECDITGDPVKSIEMVAKKSQLTKDESSGVLKHLISGGDISKYGLSNAITRFAQHDEITYDRASELEQLGATIIQLPQSQWRDIARAA